MLQFVIYVFVLHLVCQNVSLDQSLSDNVDRVQELIDAMNSSIHQQMHQTKAQMEQIQQENTRMKSEIAKLTERRHQFQEHTNSSIDVLRGMVLQVMTEGRQKQQQIANLQSEVSSLKPQCPKGSILHGSKEVCCPATCGRCGGGGCSNRPGGAHSCCHGHILNNKLSCTVSDAPCVLTKGKVSRRVYFSTHLTRDFYPHDDQIVPFNNKIVDSGNNFDINTSKFRCPLTGNYFFIMNIHSGIGESTSFVLKVDGIRKAEVYGRMFTVTFGSQFYLGLTNSVIIPCRAGQHVWVSARLGNSRVYGTSNRETTFSGFHLD